MRQILSDDLASFIHDAEHGAAQHVSGVAGLLVEAEGTRQILSDALTSFIHAPEVGAAQHLSGVAGGCVFGRSGPDIFKEEKSQLDQAKILPKVPILGGGP